MKKLKIVLWSSVLAMGLGQTAHAIYSQEDLVALRGLVDSNNASAVMAYIQANPQLLDGSDPLAEALREFIASRESFLGGIFGTPLPDLSRIPDLPPGTSSETLVASGSLSDFGS